MHRPCLKGGVMKYRVHRLDVDRDTMQEKLEQFLNGLAGDIMVSGRTAVRPYG